MRPHRGSFGSGGCGQMRGVPMRQVALGLAMALSMIGVSAAETPEERQACQDDAFKFCGQAIPDRERVFNCLVENKTVISSLCLRGLTPYLPAEPAPVASKGK